ncbi:MAG: hypothetical protein EZS28_035432 [Streblomastix strix]|uniref:Uncharacterized protein n=1 Tax=Streblomastix strix TaxID=222440 RepID=A0A5J4UG41_9EUKA|nr:MAG: hypothetical protein EZS28_035432 [Streblomastix strix]
MEEERLGMSVGHQISIQPCGSDRGVGEIPSVYAQRNTLYASGNAFRDLNSIEDLCKDNINNNRQSEKQESSPDSKLCRRHSAPDAGLALARERDRMDSLGIQEIWMGDQRKQKQIEAGLAICVSGMEVQLSNNGDLVDQREKEGIESDSVKIDNVNNGIKTLKDKKRGKFGWQAPIFHSVIQTRRTTSIANKQVNEQSCENARMDKRNDSNQEMLDRVVLVEEPGGEQQTKDYRQEIEFDNNTDGRVNRRLESECDQEQHADQKDIRIMGSGDGEFKLERDTSNIESNLSTQRLYQPIGIQLNNDRNRQYNSVFLNSKCKSKISFKESDRFDFINRRRKWMDINNKTYRWKIEQRSGRVVKVVDGGGLRNKEGSVGGSFKGLVSWDNSGFIRSKEQCKTQEILYIGQRQESGRTRFNESLLGGGVCFDTPTNTDNKQSYKENNRRESVRDNDSTKLARLNMVDRVERNNGEGEGTRREREGIRDGIEDEEEESESSSGEDIGFRGKRGQDGAKLFRNALEASGLSRNAVKSIIDNWHGSWRRHACALSAFWEYMKRKGMSIEQLSRVEKPYIIYAEYITEIIKDQSDAFVIQARTSVSTMFQLIGRE